MSASCFKIDRRTEDLFVVLGVSAGSPAYASVFGGMVFGRIFTNFAPRLKNGANVNDSQ